MRYSTTNKKRERGNLRTGAVAMEEEGQASAPRGQCEERGEEPVGSWTQEDEEGKEEEEVHDGFGTVLLDAEDVETAELSIDHPNECKARNGKKGREHGIVLCVSVHARVFAPCCL